LALRHITPFMLRRAKDAIGRVPPKKSDGDACGAAGKQAKPVRNHSPGHATCAKPPSPGAWPSRKSPSWNSTGAWSVLRPQTAQTRRRQKVKTSIAGAPGWVAETGRGVTHQVLRQHSIFWRRFGRFGDVRWHPEDIETR
jgi:hypothetical protein